VVSSVFVVAANVFYEDLRDTSTAHLLEKIQGFIIYLSRDICEIKNITTLWTPSVLQKEKMSFFFLIHLLYFKLHLMFNANISKDAARSGLSPYI